MIRSVLTAMTCALCLPGAAAAASPGENGRLIVSLSSCPTDPIGHLATLPWRGGEIKAITPLTCDGAPEADIFNPEGSPDGQSIIAVESGDDSGLTLMGRDGSSRHFVPFLGRPLLPGSTGIQPTFAPEGERFAYNSGGDVWTARTDGSAPEQLRDAACNPRWSPSGDLIAVNLGTEADGGCPPTANPMFGDESREIWALRASDGEPLRRLARRGSEFDWSPNGRNLVYRTPAVFDEEDGETRGGNIYVVSADGERRRMLVHRHRIAETHPTWSPNGRWIMWISLRYTGGDVSYDLRPTLWRVRASGGSPERVQKLPEVYMEEGMYHRPELAWLARAPSR